MESPFSNGVLLFLRFQRQNGRAFVFAVFVPVLIFTAAVTAAVFVQRLQEVLVELGHQRLVELVVDGVQREAVLVSHEFHDGDFRFFERVVFLVIVNHRNQNGVVLVLVLHQTANFEVEFLAIFGRQRHHGRRRTAFANHFAFLVLEVLVLVVMPTAVAVLVVMVVSVSTTAMAVFVVMVVSVSSTAVRVAVLVSVSAAAVAVFVVVCHVLTSLCSMG